MSKIKTRQNPAVIAILSAIIGIVVTFVFLESRNMIKHNEDKSGFPISQYHAVLIDQDAEDPYRLSRKPSNQTAQCIDGYLFIGADDDANLLGLVVDYKNRGVKCPTQSPTP